MAYRTPLIAMWSKGRRIPAYVAVGRSQGSRLFEACVKVGKPMRVTGEGRANFFCVKMNNPRKAVAAALRRAANSIEARSGAFAGLKGGR